MKPYRILVIDTSLRPKGESLDSQDPSERKSVYQKLIGVSLKVPLM